MDKLYIIYDSKGNVVDKTFDKYEAEKYDEQFDKYGRFYDINIINYPSCIINSIN